MNNLTNILTNRLSQLAHNHTLNIREQYEQRELLKSKPLQVAIPTGDRCNLRCIFCSERNSSTEYADLTFDQFLQFIEPLEYASLIQLYGWGEPFINSEYERMFDYVAKNFVGTRIYISTNGTLLTDQWIDKLVTYGKCLINISLNAATPATYEQMTKADLFSRVVDNIDKLLKTKHERDVSDLVVTLSFVATTANIHELSHFVALSDELGIQYIILQDLNLLETYHKSLFVGMEEEKARSQFSDALELAKSRGIYLDSFTHYSGTYFMQDRNQGVEIDLPRDCLSVWEQDDKPLFYPQPGECYEPYKTFLFSQDGTVTTCCRAREAMGNIFEQSFEEIWNGKVYRDYRRTINTFRPPEACLSCPVKTGTDIR